MPSRLVIVSHFNYTRENSAEKIILKFRNLRLYAQMIKLSILQGWVLNMGLLTANALTIVLPSSDKNTFLKKTSRMIL